MNLKEITPKPLRCVVGACPALFQTAEGNFVLIGKRIEYPEELRARIGPDETLIEVPRELLLAVLRESVG